MRPNFQWNIQITNEPQNFKEHQISKDTQITNNPQILKEAQIMNEPQNLKEHQISKDTQITNEPFQRKQNCEGTPNFQTTPNL